MAVVYYLSRFGAAPYTEFWLSADTGEVDDERVQVTFAYAVETTEGRSAAQVRTADVKWL
jgi:hypothetical protein